MNASKGLKIANPHPASVCLLTVQTRRAQAGSLCPVFSKVDIFGQLAYGPECSNFRRSNPAIAHRLPFNSRPFLSGQRTAGLYCKWPLNYSYWSADTAPKEMD